MTTRRSIQEWVHWLEIGAGRRWIAAAALVVGVALLSLRVGYNQFHGPLTETTMAQAVIGRQLAAGEGFSTLVLHPQAATLLRERGRDRELRSAPPDLYHAPLYPLTIAAAIKLVPAHLRAGLFAKAPVAPDGFGGDYLLLALNLVLLWIAAAQTYLLGRRLFDGGVAMVATLALLLSVSVWSEMIALNGTPLMMVLALGLFQAFARLESALDAGRAPWLAGGAIGAVCGAMALTDYAAIAALPVALGWVAWRPAGRGRAAAIIAVAALFFAVTAPWILRNMEVSGRPFALGLQGLALKAGDPTAEPVTVRASFVAEGPALSLDKLGNKGLTGLQRALQEGIWSGGGLLFTGFFVCGLLYRFRSPAAHRLRWLAVAMLLALTLAHVFIDSGEGERSPLAYAAPLIAIFGAGFFAVLAASSDTLVNHPRAVVVVVLLFQGLPLAHDVVAPRKLHFSYPPYWPALFVGLREEVDRRAGTRATWMADVPAGAAWYSGRAVWAQTATLHEYYVLSGDHPVFALVLTAQTLDRPFFSELGRRPEGGGRLSEWPDVYTALLTRRFPPGFTLTSPQKYVDNFYVLIDPFAFQALPAGK